MSTQLIFLIFGASGSGKTTFIRELETLRPTVTIHEKGTDREPRQYDGSEIRCEKNISSRTYDYIYRQYGHKYGIQKAQINAAIKEGKHHILICNDVDTIIALKRDYGQKVRVIFLRFDAPLETLTAIQKARKISDDEIRLRLEKIQVLNQTFLDRSDLFDAVIINRFDASPRRMLNQMKSIIAAEEDPNDSKSQAEIHSGLAGLADTVVQMRSNLQKHVQEMGTVVQKNYLFILMAMIRDPLLDDALAAIKRAAGDMGLKAERVDEIAFSEQITDRILASIRCAEYVIADLTHERPNVYYELGYAHAFKKNTIITAREKTVPHFDVRNYPVIFYSSGVHLERELRTQIARLARKDQANS